MNRFITICFLCLWPMTMNAQQIKIQVPAVEYSENEQTPQKRDQDRKAGKEALQAQKVAFITQKLGFTVEEAEKFWPLYNELDEKINAVMKQRGQAKTAMYRALQPRGSSEGRTRSGDHRDAAASGLPEEAKSSKPVTSIENALETFIKTFEEENQIRMEYHNKILKVLSARQLAEFYFAEEQFSNKIFRDFINKKVEEKK